MQWKLIAKGAEAYIFYGQYLSFNAIKKVRVSKKYRHPSLDIKIRMHRTKREAKLLYYAKTIAKIPAPYVLNVNLQRYELIMEYIPGRLLRDVLLDYEKEGLIDSAKEKLFVLGKILARMHNAGIIHGDFTTSNVIVHEKTQKLFIIDFGLGVLKKTKDPEDYAIELRVFKKSLDLFHAQYSDSYFEEFLEGYKDCDNYNAIIKRYHEIALRGRYVVQRRVKRTFLPDFEFTDGY